MERVTARDVTAAFKRLAQHYEPGQLLMSEGSPGHAEPWRLFVVAEHRAYFPGLDFGMLGWTRRETIQTLRGLAAGMDAQKLLQADDIREAASVLDLAYDGDPELLKRLDKLAPPTEF